MSEGMAGHGDYDRHSEHQAADAAARAGVIADAARRIGTDPARGQVVVVDYGCAQGRVSNALIKVAVETVRADHPDVPICVVHNDLLANDWQTLLAHLRDGDSYMATPGGPITPLLSATSFYRPVVPQGTVDLGMSFAAVQWLATEGTESCGSALYYDQLEGDVRAAMAQRAHEDWTRFLTRRADELAPQGRMVVDLMGVGDDGVAAGHDAWRIARSIVEELVADGRIDERRLDTFVLPVYERSADELERPFREEIGDRLRLEDLTIADSPSPAALRFAQTGGAAAFARDFVGFFRAFSEPSLRAGLGLDDATTEALYAELAERIRDGAPTFSFVVHVATAVISAR